MWEMYGKAVVEERIKPRNLAAIAEYARWEYGAGTGLGYILAGLPNGASAGRRGRRRLFPFVRAVAAAIRSFLPANGHVRVRRIESRVDD